MTDNEIETEIQAKGLTAPRITLAHVEATIVAEAYITGDAIPIWLTNPEVDPKFISGEMPALTVCVLVLRNGFKVTGMSAPSSLTNFDSNVGRMAARADAVSKVWLLEGYLLKQELFEYPYGRPKQPGRDEEGR
jgi:hypothetical protein